MVMIIKHLYIVVLTTIVSVLVVYEAQASAAGTISIDKIYKRSEFVALVKITEAKAVEFEYEGKKYTCGSEYKARVIDSFKGGTEKLVFSSEISLFVGEKYLLMLQADVALKKKPSIDSLLTPKGTKFKEFEATLSKQCADYRKKYHLPTRWTPSYFLYDKDTSWYYEKPLLKMYSPTYLIHFPDQVDTIQMHIAAEARKNIITPDLPYQHEDDALLVDWNDFANYLRKLKTEANQNKGKKRKGPD